MTPKILIACPMLQKVDSGFLTSLMGLNHVGQMHFSVEVGSLIYMARNRLAMKAVEGGFDTVLWIDSDMVFDPGLVERLWADMEEGRDFVTALYFRRAIPTLPVISKSVVWVQDEDGVRHEAEPYCEYPRDAVFEVGGSGLGACMVRTDVIVEAAQRFRTSPFDPLPMLGEDYSFCWRLGQIGKKMWCDSRIKVGHVGQFVYDEGTYIRQTEEGEQCV